MDEILEVHGVPVHLVCRDILAPPSELRYLARCWKYSWEAMVAGRQYGDFLTLDAPIFTQAREILLSQARHVIEQAASRAADKFISGAAAFDWNTKNRDV